MIPWFSKTEGNTYATIAASLFPLQGKPTHAQEVARSYENNSRLKTNRSVHFFCTVRCTKNGQIAFIYLQPVSVTIFLGQRSPAVSPASALPSTSPHPRALHRPDHPFKPRQPPDRAQAAPAPHTPMIDADAPLPWRTGGLGPPRA